jgi:hypothetical protein
MVQQIYVVGAVLVILYVALRNAERIARWLKNVLFAGGTPPPPFFSLFQGFLLTSGRLDGGAGTSALSCRGRGGKRARREDRRRW